MLGNWADNLSASPTKAVLLLATVVVVALCARKLLTQQRTYGTTSYASPIVRWGGAAAACLLILQAVLLSRPYSPPPTGSIAVVLGNTQNTPKPKLSSDVVSLLRETMLLHKGETAEEVLSAMAFVSAAGNGQVMDLGDLELVDIGVNTTVAERDAAKNVRLIEDRLNKAKPTDNGADYLEAILLAKQNADSGANIVVVGSGLSDAGDIDFAHSNLLNDEAARSAALKRLVRTYGRNYLVDSAVTFAGLGDTAPPQEPLASKQKEIVRDFYRQVITALGGKASVETRTQTGDPVTTKFTVSTTDTGCGDVGLRFGDESIQFVSNEATFIDEKQARQALLHVKEIYDDNPSAIELIKIDGYIAHVPAKDPKLLSGARAETVLKELEQLGIPRNKLEAEGKGFGPFNVPTADRMVKITISRDTPNC